jgi:uncharacterized protein
MPVGDAGGAWAALVAATTVVPWPQAPAQQGAAPGFPAGLLWAAVWEEALFRGCLLPAAAARLAGCASRFGVTAANAATSGAFAALHLIAHPPALLPAYFALSLLLGIARERSGGLALPIALHAGFNLIGWIAVAQLSPLAG